MPFEKKKKFEDDAKKKKPIAYTSQDICEDLFEIVRNQKMEDGTLLCEPFVRLPKRREDPEYYARITSPMDMSVLGGRVREGEYAGVDDMEQDFNLIISNALAFYPEGSKECRQARELDDLFKQSKLQLTSQAAEAICLAASSQPQLPTEETSYGCVQARRDVKTEAASAEGNNNNNASTTNTTTTAAISSSSSSLPHASSVKATEDSKEDIELPSTSTSLPATPHSPHLTTSSHHTTSHLTTSHHTTTTSSANSSPLKSKTEGGLDESSRSGFSNTITSGSEMDDETRQTKGVCGEGGVEVRKKRKGRRRTNKEIMEARMLEMGDDDAANTSAEHTTAEEDEAALMEQLFSTTLMSSEGLHSFTELFKIVPSKTKCPLYHQVVQEPMDLRTIARRIQAHEYAGVEDMIKDFLLIVANAKSYNEPHTRLYKEANSMKKHLLNKKQELEQRKQIRSQRTRCRTQFQSVGNMSSVFAALKSESEDERAGSDGEFSEAGHGNEQWALFNAVKAHKDASDVVLSEPFLRLPSKRFYPDYFQEIKRPMSLMKIQKKIKGGAYVGLEMLARDFELVFENAMQYNRDDSRIYKDAETLMGVVRSKVEEIVKEKSLNESSADDERRKRPRLSDEALKRNLFALYQRVLDHRVDERHLSEIFMRLPSKRDYPDYYDIITRPIDMSTIEYKIKNDRYNDVQALVDDFKLMFKNARLYNKEQSQVHNDATTLERLVNQAYLAYLQQLEIALKAPSQQSPPTDARRSSVERNSAFNRACLQRQQELYALVCNHKDQSGRSVSAAFVNLPLKSEYPDYYETISKPMDLTRVYQRIVSNGYPLLDDIFNDLSLVFTNACLYNEPDSQIYKDAVALQRVCNERKAQWNEQALAEVPCVDALLQQLLKQLVAAVVNHEDCNGRVYSNSLHELKADFISSSHANKPKKSLEFIQQEVEMGSYRRLDSLQENLVTFFEHVIRNFKHDRQMVEDSVEMMKVMITKRDQLCGVYTDHQQPLSSSSPLELQSLSSPALSYDVSKLQQLLKESGVEMMVMKKEDDDDEEEEEGVGADDDAGRVLVESVESAGQVYSVGDFVYIKACSKVLEIRKIWKGINASSSPPPPPTQASSSPSSSSAPSWVRGRVYIPPQLTKHHPRRTFLHKEVFMTSQSESFSADVIAGRCLILPVLLYALYAPSAEDAIAEKDVFVCESKYHVQACAFRVLKKWKPLKQTTNFTKRSTPCSLSRAPLGGPSQLAVPPLPTPVSLVDKQKVIVQLVNVNLSDPNIYYEQICSSNNLWIKIGDCVVVKAASVGEKARVVRVEKIWSTNRGESNISGCLLLHPSEVSQQGNRSFYRKELLLSNKEVSHACTNLSHVCCVLGVLDYCMRRVVGCPEEWTFVCDLRYNDVEKSFKKTLLPIKQAGLSDQVCSDEVVTLKKPIVITREQLEAAAARSESAGMMEEESMDFFPSTDTSSAHDSTSFVSESFSGGSICIAAAAAAAGANNSGGGVNSASGGGLMVSNSGSSINGKEDAASSVKKRKKRNSTTKVRNVTGYIVYAGECRKNIQAEFPDLNFGDISRAVGTRWKSLPRDLKERYEERARQLTQDLSRGAEVLASPAAPDSRSMSPATLVSAIHSKSLQQQQQLQNAPAILPSIDLSANQNTVTKFNHGPAIFVDVPAQTYKVAHSEAYIRYIHALAQGNKFIGDFNKTLWAKKPEPLSLDTTKLPSHWLANGPGHHGDVVSAFWALRQHMLNDALRIDRVLN